MQTRLKTYEKGCRRVFYRNIKENFFLRGMYVDEIKIEDYIIFADNLSTLKEISKDTSSACKYMDNSCLSAVEFDKVKTAYTNKLGLSEESASSFDALAFINNNGQILDLLEAHMKKLLMVIIAALIFPLAACSAVASVPETITVDNVVYRNGFYGNLFPINMSYSSYSYNIDGNELRRVNCDQFDCIHSPIGDVTEGTIYCADSQWEQAKTYYADNDNFAYYCQIGRQYDDKDPMIINFPDIDPSKLDALLDFADNNSYDPFNSNKNKNIKTLRLPIPDRDLSTELVFYKESKDGYFTSSKGDKFHVVDGKFLLVFRYDHGYGKYGEMLAVNVPDNISQYFIELLAKHGF